MVCFRLAITSLNKPFTLRREVLQLSHPLLQFLIEPVLVAGGIAELSAQPFDLSCETLALTLVGAVLVRSGRRLRGGQELIVHVPPWLVRAEPEAIAHALNFVEQHLAIKRPVGGDAAAGQRDSQGRDMVEQIVGTVDDAAEIIFAQEAFDPRIEQCERLGIAPHQRQPQTKVLPFAFVAAVPVRSAAAPPPAPRQPRPRPRSRRDTHARARTRRARPAGT